MPDKIACWNCPCLPISSLCPGFRELLEAATNGKKLEDPLCDRCPYPGLGLGQCKWICNSIAMRDGFRQVYELATRRGLT